MDADERRQTQASAFCKKRLDVGQKLSTQVGKLLEVGERFARQFVTELDGERVQFE